MNQAVNQFPKPDAPKKDVAPNMYTASAMSDKRKGEVITNINADIDLAWKRIQERPKAFTKLQNLTEEQITRQEAAEKAHAKSLDNYDSDKTNNPYYEGLLKQYNATRSVASPDALGPMMERKVAELKTKTVQTFFSNSDRVIPLTEIKEFSADFSPVGDKVTGAAVSSLFSGDLTNIGSNMFAAGKSAVLSVLSGSFTEFITGMGRDFLMMNTPYAANIKSLMSGLPKFMGGGGHKLSVEESLAALQEKQGMARLVAAGIVISGNKDEKLEEMVHRFVDTKRTPRYVAVASQIDVPADQQAGPAPAQEKPAADKNQKPDAGDSTLPPAVPVSSASVDMKAIRDTVREASHTQPLEMPNVPGMAGTRGVYQS